MQKVLIFALFLIPLSSAFPSRDEVRNWKTIRQQRPRVGHHGHHGLHEVPEFLKVASAETKEEFFKIKKDDELSREEKKELMDEWAAKNGLESEMAAYFETRKSFIEEHKEKMLQAIEDLPQAYSKVREIFEDDSLSRMERMEMYEESMKDYSEQLKSLIHATRPRISKVQKRGLAKYESRWPSHRFGNNEKSFVDQDISF